MVGGHAVLLGHGDRQKLTITVIIHTSEFVSRGAAEFFCRPPGKCRPCALNRSLTTACGGWLGPSAAAPPWGAYTKAAVIRQQQIQSPLDKLTGQSRPCPSPQQIGLPRSPAPVAQPVGRVQIGVRCRKGEATLADVEPSIFTDDRYIDLDGIVVREPAPAGLLSVSVYWASRARRKRG